MIKNPILKGFNPDPSICRVGEDYYIAVSTFEWYPGVLIYHSKDLENWRLISRAANRKSQLNMLGNPDSGGVWAPQLSYHSGMFWLIYSDVKVVTSNNFKDVNNYLITTDDIEGEWSEPIYLNSSGFDPSLFHDDDGKKYLLNMVWDYRPGNKKFYGISLQEYCHDRKELIGDRKVIYKGTELGLVEAPHLYKIDDYYYLLTAEGGTKYEHASVFSRSKTIEGPYTLHPQTPFLTAWDDPNNPLQKAGHGSLVHTHTDEWYFPHLTGRPIRLPGTNLLEDRGYCPLGRETAIQKVYWKDGWPYIENGPHPSLYVKKPKMETVEFAKTYSERDDFDEPELNIHFQSLRHCHTNFSSLSERPGYLRLYGGESMNSLFRQSLVARRWESLNFESETSVEFNADNFQQLAGMINYYNIRNWSSIHITHDEDLGKVIQVLVSDKGRMNYPLSEAIQIPEDVSKVYFKTKVSGLHYTYLYSFDGLKWVKTDLKLMSHKLSDDYIYQDEDGFFTGAFVGMHAMDLTGQKKHADFDYFTYIEHE